MDEEYKSMRALEAIGIMDVAEKKSRIELKQLTISHFKDIVVRCRGRRVPNVETAELFKKEAQELLLLAKFDLRGWKFRPSAGKKMVSILEMLWDTREDCLKINLENLKKRVDGPATKRMLLSVANMVFDSQGLKWKVDVLNLERLKIPRWLTGRDNMIRTALVRTKDGDFLRFVQRLYRLEVKIALVDQFPKTVNNEVKGREFRTSETVNEKVLVSGEQCVDTSMNNLEDSKEAANSVVITRKGRPGFHVLTERTEVTHNDKKYLEVWMKTGRGNRTTIMSNATIDIYQTIPETAVVRVLGYEFKSNEYRQSAIDISRYVCDYYTGEYKLLFQRTMEKIGHVPSKCPLEKV
ncbi:hypothetical protein ILUMI_19626 [Ignelater luminosus]|uniref:Uncharacterized protein n=1 Tax=Ignelater luminosus TaxID=2038154 RepID=A0A8K0CLC4_IGNLU|nr:hypothetical protein ILUMI_19626 [Ignelater luminosus]